MVYFQMNYLRAKSSFFHISISALELLVIRCGLYKDLEDQQMLAKHSQILYSFATSSQFPEFSHSRSSNPIETSKPFCKCFLWSTSSDLWCNLLLNKFRFFCFKKVSIKKYNHISSEIHLQKIICFQMLIINEAYLLARWWCAKMRFILSSPSAAKTKLLYCLKGAGKLKI